MVNNGSCLRIANLEIEVWSIKIKNMKRFPIIVNQCRDLAVLKMNHQSPSLVSLVVTIIDIIVYQIIIKQLLLHDHQLVIVCQEQCRKDRVLPFRKGKCPPQKLAKRDPSRLVIWPFQPPRKAPSQEDGAITSHNKPWRINFGGNGSQWCSVVTSGHPLRKSNRSKDVMFVAETSSFIRVANSPREAEVVITLLTSVWRCLVHGHTVVGQWLTLCCSHPQMNKKTRIVGMLTYGLRWHWVFHPCPSLAST